MSYQGGADYERAFRVAYGVFVVAMIGAVIYMTMRPTRPPPANGKAFGCYTTANAPPISLDARGMIIHQSAPIRIGFHLERHKTGIALTADAPIEANPTQTGYIYSIRPPGIGWFMDFFHEVDGRSYGVFDENALRQFTMLARDGIYLPYRKADPVECEG
ncbi:MAG: hypothetical protein JNJ92_06640 [Altererythrobacter sp.]|nr:hypothetical protein [Altererythrobacter sp.]